jgi:hypothetical protein
MELGKIRLLVDGESPSTPAANKASLSVHAAGLGNDYSCTVFLSVLWRLSRLSRLLSVHMFFQSLHSNQSSVIIN